MTVLLHEGFDTPVGELNVFATDDGVVRAAGFRPAAQVALQVPSEVASTGWSDASLPLVSDAVASWMDGDGRALSSVPVAQKGGPFFREVWEAVRAIPPGEPQSYQEVAAAAGRPRAMRAAGTACGHNAVALFIPCHRVIGAGGRLGHYGPGGVGIKAALLAFEAGWSEHQIWRAEREAHPDAQAPAVGVQGGRSSAAGGGR